MPAFNVSFQANGSEVTALAKVTKNQPAPVVPPAEYVLTMSEKQALVIRRLLSAAGGDTRSTWASELEPLRDALDSVGIDYDRSQALKYSANYATNNFPN